MPVDSLRPSALSPQSLARPAVIVCEPEPYWTPELQRQFLAEGIAVRGCRKWSEMAEIARTIPHAVQVVDLGDAAAECLAGLGRRRSERRFRPLIVVASPRFAELEWVLREAGVQAFFAGSLPGDELARCCRRWLSP